MTQAMAQTPTEMPVTLESQGITVSLAGTPDLDGFVAAANAKAHLRGLADALNPGIVDPARLHAMVAALPAQPEAVRAALAGHTLSVGAAGFGVLAVEPARADAFGPGYRLTVERLAGTHVLAHAAVAMDAQLARERTVAAKAAVAQAQQAVQSAEKGRADPDGLDLGGLRWRRARAALGWLIAAKGWQSAAPGDAGAKQAVAEAGKAAGAYDMPSGGQV